MVVVTGPRVSMHSGEILLKAIIGQRGSQEESRIGLLLLIRVADRQPRVAVKGKGMMKGN
jgi:hypothetical protein